MNKPVIACLSTHELNALVTPARVICPSFAGMLEMRDALHVSKMSARLRRQATETVTTLPMAVCTAEQAVSPQVTGIDAVTGELVCTSMVRS